MTLKLKIQNARQSFFKAVEKTFQFLAKFYGYPENPGMPIVPTAEYFWNKHRFSDDFPVHQKGFPVPQTPSNLLETLIGDLPKVREIPRLYYENKNDGFYSFYIENYKNIIFLPNLLSEYLQIRFDIAIDLAEIEIWRMILFATLLAYLHVINFRFYLTWIVTINPYTMPIVLITTVVDWTEEVFLGLLPTILGVSPGGIVLSGVIGMMADSISHIVFTMPFLPSEGEPLKIALNGDVRNVLRFRYLPILWYRHPIPDKVREFWYTERPDILKYMQKAYKNLPIEFLPDRIINEDLETISKLSNSSDQEFVHILTAQVLTNVEIDNHNLNIFHNFQEILNTLLPKYH